MNSKLNEDLKLGVAIKSQDIRTAGSLFNGTASGSGTYIDTTGYDSIVFQVNVGIIGAGNTLALRVLTCDEDSTTLCEALSGAAFTNLTNANDEQLHVAEIKCSEYQRYMWLESFKTSTGSCNIGVTYAMSGGIRPQSNSPVFDLDDSV